MNEIELKKAKHQQWLSASKKAKEVLKVGDRVGVVQCQNKKKVITFSHFDGNWIVSKSGINDYSPCSVYSLNGNPVSFVD
jgi:dsDNA-specific endonuclease/ATPase MutS2